MVTVKKYPIVLMSFLIIGMIIFCVPHHAQATELDNIIDDVQILDRDGKPIDSENDPDRVVDSQEDIVVVYNWSIKDNQQVHAGDTVHIQIPKEFKIYTTVQGELVISDGGASCGEFEIATDGMMTITFNDYVENHSISHGIVEVYTNFDLAELDDETPTTIVFPISENDSEEFTIKIKPDVTNAFEKKGSTVQNAQIIDWEVKINQELATHNNASVEDFPGNSQEILFDSFEVHEMNMHIDGTYEIGDVVAPSEYTVSKITNTSGQTGFRLTFKNPIDSAYQITYQTEVTDFNKATFSNTATFISDETEEVMDANVVIPRDPIIQKYPLLFDTTSNKISWKVEYNQGHYALDNSVMVDTYIDEQSFGGITRIVNGDTGMPLLPTEYTVTDMGEAGFKIELPDDGYYTIYFETIVPEGTTGMISNTASIDSPNIPDNEAEGDYFIPEISPTEGLIDKKIENFNAKTGELTWEIIINKDGGTLHNPVITDEFPEGGLIFHPATLKIMDSEQVKLDSADYEVVPLNGDSTWEKGFQINFNRDITGQHVITYKTQVNPSTHTSGDNEYTNNATIKTDTAEESDSDTKWIDKVIDADGYKNGVFNYKTGEIEWKLIFNNSSKLIAKPTIKDSLNSGQEFIQDSIEIHKIDFSATPQVGDLIPPENYDVTFTKKENGNEQMIITFKKPLIHPVEVTYKTKPVGITKPLYKNKAVISDGEEVLADYEAEVIDDNANKYVNKAGEQVGDNIDWEIYANQSGSTISNATVTDTLGTGQKLDTSSIKVYKAQTSVTGKMLQESNAPISPDEYDLKTGVDEESNLEYFQVKFKNEINQSYVIKYQTAITLTSDTETTAEIGNSVTFTGDNITKGETEKSKHIEVKITTGDGTGTGETGKITLNKVDKADPSISLEGATFDLYANDKKVDTQTTDKNGVIEFSDLIYGDYTLKEVSAPEGYSLPTASTENIQVKLEQDEKVIQVTNEKTPIKETGAVHIVKTDKATGAKLAGAEFSLFDETGTELQTGLTTDENGELTIDNLDLGNYYLKETKAPEGYKLAEKTWDFSVETGKLDAVEVQVDNEKDLGEVILTKVDSETNAKLSGAKFNILNAPGEVIQTNLVSDGNGEIRVQNLEPGDYAFQEIEAPTNYDLAAKTWPFTITKGQTTATVVTAENNKTGTPDIDTGEVVLVKQDSATGETLEGAVFDLLDADGTIITSNLTTDNNGEITITNLAPGKYSFKETKAPAGYELASDAWEFTIEPNQPQKITITAENTKSAPTPEVGSVKIIKQDSENAARLAGAEFSLLTENGETLQTNLTTNEAGELEIYNLTPGNYRIQETKAPDGYQLETTPWQFEIVANNTSQITVVAENTKLNPVISETGAVRLIKTDSETGMRLSGAVFSLLDESGKVIQANLTTGENGEIFIEDLTPGNYSLKETKAPDGYELAEQPWNFQIVKGQVDAVIIKAENSPIAANGTISFEDGGTAQPGSIEIPADENNATATEITKLPQTGDKSLFPRVILGESAVLLSLLYLRKKSA
ncbi:SpaA isopeptide-forming pilin-related protein [Listeria swaminathanii]|uniref:Collagen-binding protein n=1 Tax=Listeria swaminathanii TaxID=2713501 RepID=A0A7X1A263_9LIST|nr:SpaA isopeptide-forming pilin-related protein [Listeria swaminathanii]MBC2330634.1 collagen-binding protein [Listeria swaminathanii]